MIKLETAEGIDVPRVLLKILIAPEIQGWITVFGGAYPTMYASRPWTVGSAQVFHR